MNTNRLATSIGVLGLATFFTAGIATGDSQIDSSYKVLDNNRQVVSHALASNSTYTQATRSGFKWGAPKPATTDHWAASVADSSGYKWNQDITDTGSATQNFAGSAGFKWATMSFAKQTGYKWGVRSFSDQAGYKWGVRSFSDQAGYKWGVRSFATQAGYKWGVR